MKKLYERFFQIQEDGKIREKVMNARLVLAAIVIIVCMFCMGITAYAYFSCTVTSKISIIKSAKFYLNEKITEVLPEDAPDDAVAVGIVKNAEGYYVLEHKLPVVEESEQMEVTETAEDPAPVEDKVFEIKLTKPADVTASVGFARLEVLTDTEEKQLFYTEPIRRSETADEYVLYVHVPEDKSVKIRIVDNWGTCAKGPVLKNGAAFTPDFADAAYLHLSFDEVEISLTNLAEKEYKSIYEEPFFAWMRELHETYGAKFSLYTYTSVLETRGDALKEYRKEFAEAKDWLKFGLYAQQKDVPFAEAADGAQVWDEFVAKVVNITGTKACVDYMPRLHQAADAKLMGAMKSAGAKGFLVENHAVADYPVDQEQSLVYVELDLCLEQLELSKGSLTEDLTRLYEKDVYAFVVTGHEGQFYDENGFIKGIDDAKGAGEIWQTWIEEICRFANEKSIYFHYSEMKTFKVPEVEEPEEAPEIPEEQEETTETEEQLEAPVEDLPTEEPTEEVLNDEDTESEPEEETIKDVQEGQEPEETSEN